MTMRKYILASLTVLPLLFTFSHAAQNWSVDPPAAYGFPSEDSSTGSYLGVDISDVSTERLSALKLKEEKGVEVTMVDQDAPAGKAGIKEHDVILSMNGTSIESQVQLKRMIRETPPGRVVTFGISRDGQPMTIKVQLADRRKQYAWEGPKMKDFHVEIPSISINPDIEIPQINVVVVRSSARSGLMVENITPQLGEFFGVKDGNGVLVRAVEKGSRGEKAGFRAGDIIVKINDKPVHDTGDFTDVMHSRDTGTVSVGVIRDKKEQNLNLELPPHGDSGALIEEDSLDEPLLNAETELEVSKLEGELAEVQPDMNLISDESARAEQAVDVLRQDTCAQQRAEQMKQLEKRTEAQSEALKSALDQMRQAQPKALQPEMLEKMNREQKLMKQQQEKLKIDMERMLRVGRSGGFDI
ncbi:MAG: PDZ domain-containing protein [Candidatus Sulfotelmatobacter sp.]|jgi:membrane-associated protease RseP (regulator of RpoE activity)